MEETQASVAAVVAAAHRQTEMILALVETAAVVASVFGPGDQRS
jgi:hypothetical protein